MKQTYMKKQFPPSLFFSLLFIFVLNAGAIVFQFSLLVAGALLGILLLFVILSALNISL